MQKANGKEIYVMCLILLIGLIYLAAQADSLFSIGSSTVQGDVIQLSKNEILSHTRTVLTILLCFSGSILLFKIKRSGWIISQTLLLLMLTIASGIFISNLNQLGALGFTLMGGIILLLLAVFFLLQKSTRERFGIAAKSFLWVMILFSILAGFYFLLQ